MATAEFSKFADILSAALSQHHLLGFEIAQWNSITSTSFIRGDKKAFFSDQCKEIEENNRMGKTRYLFKKIHAKMETTKDRNGMT